MNENSKTVVITGASSGLGEGAAKAFADKGYRVWGTMLEEMQLDAVLGGGSN